MAKIKARQTIKHSDDASDKTVFVIKKDNMLLLNDEDTMMKFVIINQNLNLIRDNKEMHMEIMFSLNEEKEGYYELKQTNTTLPLKILTERLEIVDNRIEIIYNLYIHDEYVDKFNYKLDWSD